ncbi:hypothetical protein E8E13_006142 [Curvularia kusanoi]|uniref:Uncharacterized protein n=1 Tax=Curvularia kusanoi TaxID=90978 RepID=A0A9P4W8E8_CURKU|nr:hypothetical protein E8E13_006142 [Curvularia kusanoi]
MSSHRDVVDVPRPSGAVTFGLLVLAIFLPFLALYLDGSSWPTVGINFAMWFFFPGIGWVVAPIHAFICLLRTDTHRQYSKPARRRLLYDKTLSRGKPGPVDSASANRLVPTQKAA